MRSATTGAWTVARWPVGCMASVESSLQMAASSPKRIPYPGYVLTSVGPGGAKARCCRQHDRSLMSSRRQAILAATILSQSFRRTEGSVGQSWQLYLTTGADT